MPEGMGEWQWDDKDPLIPMARQAAHDSGLTQDQFSKFMGIYAATRVGDMQSIKAAKDAEIAKLGPTASAQIDSVLTWMNAKGYVHLPKMMVTADMVREFQKLITDSTTQGSGSFSQTGRDSPDGNGKIPGYDKMSFAQKREAQDQVNASRGGRPR